MFALISVNFCACNFEHDFTSLIRKYFITANSVFMTDAPPPYPGINGYSSGGYLGAGGFVSPPGPPSSTGGAQGGATGFTPNASDAKAAEAAGLQTGYVDPNNPQVAYLPQVIESLFH